MNACTRVALAAMSGLLLSAPAFAASSIVFSLTPTGPATCSGIEVIEPVTGSVTFDLPPPPNNLYTVLTVNGVAQPAVVQSINGPFPGTVPGAFLIVDLPGAVTPPYTFSKSILPAANGVPTGTGVRVSGTCAAGGAATMVTQAVSAGAAPVPTLPASGLALLALLLALAGGRRFASGARRH